MRRCLLWWLLILMALVSAGSGAGAASKDAPRLALVIGNAGYRSNPLPTAANDAGLVAQALAQVGFDVMAARDPDAATFRKTVGAFAERLRDAGPDTIVFVYLSGYGVQFAGENFVVPVDARIDRQVDVPDAAVPLAEVQHALESLPARARLFVYDLARENQFAGAEAVPLAGGLALVHAPQGSLYAFNAAPGTVAPADLPPYGLYARALAETLRTQGLTIQAMFGRLRLRIADITSGAVVPWDDANVAGAFTLLAATSGRMVEASAVSIDALPEDSAFWTAIAQDRLATYEAFSHAFASGGLAARLQSIIAVRLEAETWSESVRVDVPGAYWSYMQRYPRGPHYVDVRRRLAALRAALEPPSRFEPYAFADLPMPSPEQVRRVERQNLTFDDPEGPPMPKMPDAFLPPAPAATDLELAPPPLVPTGVLPVPMPLPPIDTAAWPATPGRIDQPFVPGLGLVTIETRALASGPSMTLSTEAGLVTRTAVGLEKGVRTILQTDAADEIVSQTGVTTRADGTLVSIVQTGFHGETLGRIVTRVDPLGERSTTVSDDRDRLIGEIRADRRGVVRDVTRGAVVWVDTTFDLPLSETAPSMREKASETPSVQAPPAAPAVPTVPPVMPALESPPAVVSVPPPAPTRAVLVKPTDVGPPPPAARQPAPKAQPLVTSPPPAPQIGAPAPVPLPVPRPPPAVLKSRQGAGPSHAPR